MVAAATVALVGVTWLLKVATDEVARGTQNLVTETSALARSTEALVTATKDLESLQRQVEAKDAPDLVIERVSVVVPTPGQGSRYVAFKVTNRGKRPATITRVEVGVRSSASQAWDAIPFKYPGREGGIQKTATYGSVGTDEGPPMLEPGETASLRAQVDPIPRKHMNADLSLRINDSSGASRDASFDAPIPQEWFRVVGQ